MSKTVSLADIVANSLFWGLLSDMTSPLFGITKRLLKERVDLKKYMKAFKQTHGAEID